MKRKRDRKLKPESERRSKPFQVMLTPGEYYELQRRADERNLAASVIVRREVFGDSEDGTEQ